ncbi:4Fe-4S binding protein [Falsigemmobacter intermedius]|uniref:4Fe-4S binding protein n=1 Tax=Falsigemmobacter intermedius TaxID=1553448 RepID=UPI003F03824C
MTRHSACSLTCNCLGSLMPDAAALSRAGFAPMGGVATELCGEDLNLVSDAVGAALQEGRELVIGCRRKESFFRDLLAGSEIDLNPGFVDVHAHALWSDEAAEAGPKLAALHAKAAIELPPVTTVSYDSQGVTLILGRDDRALELARALQGQLDVTVLLQPGAEAVPRSTDAFPVAQGLVKKAEGWLGGFKLVIDAYSLAHPAPRSGYGFGEGRDGAVSNCDLVIDLTGGAPLFSAHDLRPGYLRDDPARPGVVAELALKAAGHIGTFDKERFVSLNPGLCAHSRNRISGCSNCVDLCPTGAITPGGDVVSIDPMICAGCGQCAAACPGGAISYDLPPVGTLAEQLRAMLTAYETAGGTAQPVILFADSKHGMALIELSARLGRGLPAHVLPFEVNELTRLGPDTLAATLAWGADVVLLAPERPGHPLDGLQATLRLIGDLTGPMGYGAERLVLLQTDDPEVLESHLRQPRGSARPAASRFLPPSDKRGLMTTALTELNRLAPASQSLVPLAKGAPFGAVVLDTSACTLCMACAGACPAGALIDNPETPMLRFTESACLQCGICEATCPEKAISLTPQADFTAWDQPKRVLHEEEPFCCTGCGKGFGTRSGIERIMAKLEGHWMFTGARGNTGISMLTLCEDCRVKRAAEAGFEAHH